MGTTRIEIVVVPDCPNAAVAEGRVRAAAAGRSDLLVDVIEVADEGAAAERGMHGSPTILIDGVDPFSPPGAVSAMMCRIVPGGDPVPSEGTIRAALEPHR